MKALLWNMYMKTERFVFRHIYYWFLNKEIQLFVGQKFDKQQFFVGQKFDNQKEFWWRRCIVWRKTLGQLAVFVEWILQIRGLWILPVLPGDCGESESKTDGEPSTNAASPRVWCHRSVNLCQVSSLSGVHGENIYLKFYPKKQSNQHCMDFVGI